MAGCIDAARRRISNTPIICKPAGCKYPDGDCTAGALGGLPDRRRRMKKISDSDFQISYYKSYG